MPTKVVCFLDTNILIYAAVGSVDEPDKFKICRERLSAWDFGTSGQVLAEFYVIAQSKKFTLPLSAKDAGTWVTELQDRPCVPVDASLVQSGIALSQRFRISYWDGAILAAAERLGSPVVYSEDMNHGQSYGAVRVLNPFK